MCVILIKNNLHICRQCDNTQAAIIILDQKKKYKHLNLKA